LAILEARLAEVGVLGGGGADSSSEAVEGGEEGVEEEAVETTSYSSETTCSTESRFFSETMGSSLKVNVSPGLDRMS